MSTVPDFCCDNKCISIKKCDGPWCLQERCSCAGQCDTVPASPDAADSLHQAELKLTSTKCCGTVGCGDTLHITGSGVNGDFTISYIGNGVIVAKNGDQEAIRLEGYKGHLVHVEYYKGSKAPLHAIDGLRSNVTTRVSAQRKCANQDCSTQIGPLGACSEDAPCGCPCADGAAEDTGSDTESVIGNGIAQTNNDSQV